MKIRENIISVSPMSPAQRFIPKVSFFLAGAFVGMRLCARIIETGSGHARARAYAQALRELRRLVESLEARLVREESLSTDELRRLEARLEGLAMRIAETPSTSEIVAAVEKLLSRTVTRLDDSLSAQAHSIAMLKSTVSQTDALLERVLESIDSLELEGEPAVVVSQPVLENPPS
jgi:hypothetical protein